MVPVRMFRFTGADKVWIYGGQLERGVLWLGFTLHDRTNTVFPKADSFFGLGLGLPWDKTRSLTSLLDLFAGASGSR